MGSYVPAFYLTGIVVLLGASVIFLIPFLKLKSQTKSTEKEFEELIVVEKCTAV